MTSRADQDSSSRRVLNSRSYRRRQRGGYKRIRRLGRILLARNEAARASISELLDRGELLREDLTAKAREAVGATAIVLWQGFDETAAFETGQGSIQGCRPQANASEMEDVLDHRVTVFRPLGQTRKDQQPGLRWLTSLARITRYLGLLLNSALASIS